MNDALKIENAINMATSHIQLLFTPS